MNNKLNNGNRKFCFRSSCLCFPSAGIKGACHHRLARKVFNVAQFTKIIAGDWEDGSAAKSTPALGLTTILQSPGSDTSYDQHWTACA